MSWRRFGGEDVALGGEDEMGEVGGGGDVAGAVVCECLRDCRDSGSGLRGVGQSRAWAAPGTAPRSVGQRSRKAPSAPMT